MKPKIILDETQFGNIYQDPSWPLYNVYNLLEEDDCVIDEQGIQEDNRLEHITQRRFDPNDPVLVAVSKSQFKCWSGWDIVCELNGPTV